MSNKFPLASYFTPGGIRLDKDINGSHDAPVVVGIQGRPIDERQPSDGNALIWSASNNKWMPIAPTGAPGPTGAIGPTGAPGAAGATGAMYTGILLQKTISWTSGLDPIGLAVPIVESDRESNQTTGTSFAVIKSWAMGTDKMVMRVYAEVIGNRTDVDGDAAWFARKMVVKRNANGFAVLKTDADADGPFSVGTATSWLATLNGVTGATGAAPTVELRVTGETGKTIHWSMVDEKIEATP
jgi:hypothetical protein